MWWRTGRRCYQCSSRRCRSTLRLATAPSTHCPMRGSSSCYRTGRRSAVAVEVAEAEVAEEMVAAAAVAALGACYGGCGGCGSRPRRGAYPRPRLRPISDVRLSVTSMRCPSRRDSRRTSHATQASPFSHSGGFAHRYGTLTTGRIARTRRTTGPPSMAISPPYTRCCLNAALHPSHDGLQRSA